jgi:hypothetical protein
MGSPLPTLRLGRTIPNLVTELAPLRESVDNRLVKDKASDPDANELLIADANNVDPTRANTGY